MSPRTSGAPDGRFVGESSAHCMLSLEITHIFNNYGRISTFSKLFEMICQMEELWERNRNIKYGKVQLVI